MKYKYLTRSNDADLQIDTVEEAKRYFFIDVEDMLIEDHRFNEDLMSCKSLEQVADLYNSRTDNLFDGSWLTVEEINLEKESEGRSEPSSFDGESNITKSERN